MARHVRIIGCLMVVRQQGLALIVGEVVLQIKLVSHVVLELLIIGDLVVQSTQTRLEESL
jgi:hypothetical protein